MRTKKNILKTPYESESWSKMGTMSFAEIMAYSNMFPKWADWHQVKYSKEYASSILKPVNLYASFFSIRPSVKRISDTVVILEYYNYADILVQIADPPLGHLGIFKSQPINEIFYSVDKVWQRQFYPSPNEYDIENEYIISDRCFKIYTPWVIDENVSFKVYSSIEDPSLLIINQSGSFTKSDENDRIKEPVFVDFYFTKSKRHMQTETVGVIERGSYIFEMEVTADKELIDRLCNE
jgi:hypothetical protein